MKAKRLAELLLETPEAEVSAWDADIQMYCPVTGLVVSADETGIELYTDD